MSLNMLKKSLFTAALIYILLNQISLNFALNGIDLELSETSTEEVLNSTHCCIHLSSEKKPWEDFKLSPNIFPIHYDIVFNPSIESNIFDGKVNITVDVVNASCYFVVHAKELDILKSEVYDTERMKLIGIKRRFHHEIDYFIIETINKVKRGKYILSFEFSGTYKHGVGLYKEEYNFDKDDKRYLAMTFFAPNNARRAFPSFDEPSFKATFSVGVIHKSTHFAISNMPVKSEIKMDNGTKLTKFEKTPPMSTYLLCIVVCDFEYKETITDNGIKIRGYASKNTIEKTETALNWTSKILTYYESSLNVTYPLKKLDFISLPEFDANGMENWGLITYKGESLLVDNTSSVTHKQKVAILVAHELAHMWFGNLVTMDWWNETWLNEGFATHFAWKGAKHVAPEYFMIDDSGITDVSDIMKQDETIYSRPVIRAVTEVIYSDVYNSIVYKKGASLLRMLEKYIHESNFLEGISKYLTKHAYGNAKTEFLWNEINEHTKKQGIDVSKLMESWLSGSNFPYIDVRCQMQNNCSCEIFQNRFLLDPSPNQLNQQFLWSVPLSYKNSESDFVQYILLNSEHEHVPWNCTKFLKFNSYFTGYFSVKYSEKEWKDFIHLLGKNITVLHATDRLNLLFDAFTLASDNLISYDIPLNLTRYLKKEEYHNVWSLYLTFIDTIKGYLLGDKNATSAIKIYTKRLGKQLYRKYNWGKDGDFFEKNLRRQIIRAMCDNNAKSCIEVAVRAYKKWINGEMPNAEVSDLVFKYGLKALNDEESYNYIWNQYLNETNPLLKAQYRDALSNVRKPSLLKRLFKDCMDRRYFRLSWQVPMIKSIAENERGFPIVAKYIFNKWNDLVRKLGNDQAVNLAETVFSKYQTTDDLHKVQEFYNKHLQATKTSKVGSRTIDSIQLRISWKEKFQTRVTQWFHINSKH